EVLDWFKDWIGYPAEAAGVLLSGGSAANLTALTCAREALVGPMRDDLVAYVSDQAHSSLARAARVMGFGPDQLRVLPSGAARRRAFTLVPDYLADAAGDGDAVDFADRGLQLSRSARALKVWMSIRALGLRAFRQAIDRCLDLAAEAAARVEASPDLELLS